MTLVDALWVGPSGYQLPQGTVNKDGEAVYKVPEFEALESDNWLPLTPTTPTSTPPLPGGKD